MSDDIFDRIVLDPVAEAGLIIAIKQKCETCENIKSEIEKIARREPEAHECRGGEIIPIFKEVHVVEVEGDVRVVVSHDRDQHEKGGPILIAGNIIWGARSFEPDNPGCAASFSTETIKIENIPETLKGQWAEKIAERQLKSWDLINIEGMPGVPVDRIIGDSYKLDDIYWTQPKSWKSVFEYLQSIEEGRLE